FKIHIMDEKFSFVSTGDCFDLTARVDEIALAVKLADIPRRLSAHAIDRPDIDAVGDRSRRLFEFPQVFREPRNSCRGIDDVFSAVEGKRPPTFGEMTIVADVDAELAIAGLEDRIAGRTRLEEELLPETGDLRDVRLTVFSEIGAVGIEH